VKALQIHLAHLLFLGNLEQEGVFSAVVFRIGFPMQQHFISTEAGGESQSP
jgi:hypothetical protein